MRVVHAVYTHLMCTQQKITRNCMRQLRHIHCNLGSLQYIINHYYITSSFVYLVIFGLDFLFVFSSLRQHLPCHLPNNLLHPLPVHSPLCFKRRRNHLLMWCVLKMNAFSFWYMQFSQNSFIQLMATKRNYAFKGVPEGYHHWCLYSDKQ